MNSESGQRLPMEELKRRNAPQSMMPQNCPSHEEWAQLLAALSTAQEQFDALTQELAALQAQLKQAGKRNERSISPPSLETAMSVIVWLALLLLGTMVGMVVLQAIWSGLAALWSAVKLLIP